MAAQQWVAELSIVSASCLHYSVTHRSHSTAHREVLAFGRLLKFRMRIYILQIDIISRTNIQGLSGC